MQLWSKIKEEIKKEKKFVYVCVCVCKACALAESIKQEENVKM